MRNGLGRLLIVSATALFTALSGGCALGPQALEHTHGRYNEAVKQVTEEQLLLNLVRLRYNDNVGQLDVSAIAAQYELGSSVEARPFDSSQAARVTGPPPYAQFTNILPFASLSGTNRPTISMTPLDDPETIRGLFVPSTLDGIVFLAETSWPVSTVFRLWVESLNRVPNAMTASGPARGIVPDYHEFQRVTQLMQSLQDAGSLRFVRQEKLTEVGGSIPETMITATAMVDAAKAGLEYRANPDKTWSLVRRDRRLEMRLLSTESESPASAELVRLLGLKPGLTGYEVAVGAPAKPLERNEPTEQKTTINLYPRSTAQAMFYLSYGVNVPVEHYNAGLVRPTLVGDHQLFDWQEVTKELFTVHSCKSHRRPKCAYVAVKYRDHWYYIDDCDADSKTTFSLISIMSRVNLLGTKKGGPALTLPIGR